MIYGTGATCASAISTLTYEYNARVPDIGCDCMGSLLYTFRMGGKRQCRPILQRPVRVRACVCGCARGRLRMCFLCQDAPVPRDVANSAAKAVCQSLEAATKVGRASIRPTPSHLFPADDLGDSSFFSPVWPCVLTRPLHIPITCPVLTLYSDVSHTKRRHSGQVS